MNTTPAPAPQQWSAKLWANVLVVLPSVLRLIPYIKPPNLSPIGAMSLVGGARQPLWQALLTPMLVMVATDLVLRGVYGWKGFDPFVYSAFALTVLLGRLLRQSRSPFRIGAAGLAGSILFFLVSNFGVWFQAVLGDPKAIYPATSAGLLTSYVQGIPFFALTVLGDLGFGFAFFGLYDWLASPAPAALPAPVEEAAQ